METDERTSSIEPAGVMATACTHIVRFQGRSLVDVQDLARITSGSLSFEGNRIILRMSLRDAADQSAENAPERFS